MKKIIAIAAIAAASAVVSTSASAFWGGDGPFSWGNGSAPWSTFADSFGMNEVNFSSRTYGNGHGDAYGAPYYGYGYGPYGYAAPYAATPYGVAPVAPVAPQAPVAQ